MKIINKIYLLGLMVLLAFVGGCQEDSLVEPTPSPITPTGNLGVYFPSSNKADIELNPTVSSDFELVIARKDSTNAVEVPLTVLVNADDVFVVPEKVSFAANQRTTKIRITFPTAESGREYALRIGVEGDQFVNNYSMDPIILSTNVALVQWNDLGKQLFFDSFAFEGESESYYAEVKLEQRDDKKDTYRISYPYTDAIWEALEEDWSGGKTQKHIVFQIKDKNAVTWEKFWYTSLLYQAGAGQDIKAYLPSARSAGNKENDKLSVAVTDDADKIQYIHFVPEYYIDGLGGYGLQEVFLSFPGYDLKELLGDMAVIPFQE